MHFIFIVDLGSCKSAGVMTSIDDFLMYALKKCTPKPNVVKAFHDASIFQRYLGRLKTNSATLKDDFDSRFPSPNMV